MKCVINALETAAKKDQPLTLTPLHGVNLLERTLVSAANAGLKDFLLLSTVEDTAVRQFADGLAKDNAYKITHVIAKQHETVGELLLSLQSALTSPFIYLSVFYQFDGAVLQAVLRAKTASDTLRLTVDAKDVQKKRDWMHALRVDCEKGKVKSMSVDLATFNGFMTGVMLCPPRLLTILAAQQQEKITVDLLQAMQVLIRDEKVEVQSVTDTFWCYIDSFHTLRVAEDELIRGFRLKSRDSFLKQHFFRPLSTMLSSWLVNSKLPLNYLVVTNLIVAMLAGLLFSIGSYSGLLVGGILTGFVAIMQLSIKEVAWLRLERNRAIVWYGSLSVKYSEVILLMGLTIHLVFDNLGSYFIWVGFLAVIGNMMLHYAYEIYKRLVHPRPSKLDGLLMQRETRFSIIAVGAILNLPGIALLVMAILCNIVVIRRFFLCQDVAE